MGLRLRLAAAAHLLRDIVAELAEQFVKAKIAKIAMRYALKNLSTWLCAGIFRRRMRYTSAAAALPW